jgi:hypothetical protein
MNQEGYLFESTHDALIFAFNNAEKSPKSSLAGIAEEYKQIGTGRGLHGMDAATQAAFIINAVLRLKPDLHNVIVARYFGNCFVECWHCEGEGPRKEWKKAIKLLAHMVDLKGAPLKLKEYLVAKLFAGDKLESARIARRFDLSARTLQREMNSMKAKFRKLERAAIDALDNEFYLIPELLPAAA